MARISLASKGLKPTIDNSVIINHQLELAKERDTIYLPAGFFPLHNPIIQENKTLNWECAFEGTVLAPATGKSGIIMRRTTGAGANGAGTSHMECPGLVIQNHYSNWGPGGPAVQNKDMGHVGLTCWVQAVIKYITVRNFFGRGMEFSGVVEKGSNCSGNIVEGCLVGLNYIGIYVQGPDNNAIKFISNDIRDNYYLGAEDASFLGCTWIGNMFHNNQGGNIRAVETTQSRWIANYSEGNVPDVYGGQSDVLIGQQGPGVEILDTAVVSYRGQNLTKEKPSI